MTRESNDGSSQSSYWIAYRLVCDSEYRLGRNGAEEIKAHPFFAGVNWATLRSEPSPYVPQLTSITDTSHFPTEELEAVPEAVDTSMMQGKHDALYGE